MTVHLSIFGRGRTLVINNFDACVSRQVYFAWMKQRRGIIKRVLAIEASDDGGIRFRRLKDGRTQGWRLRGPVEHFEY